jgi:hypothetical protein
VAARIPDAGPRKTAGPRFDTLIVRGEPAKGAGGFPRTEKYCTTECGKEAPVSRNVSVPRNFVVSRNV